MKLKRTMAILMAGVTCAGALAGCGGSGSKDTGSAASNSGGLTELTFVMASRDEFMSSIEEAMVAEAEPLGYKIVSQDAQNDSSKQIQYIETAVNGGADERRRAQRFCAAGQAGGDCADTAGHAGILFFCHKRQPPWRLPP